MLARQSGTRKTPCELHVGDRGNSIDRGAESCDRSKARKFAYDRVVLATGSFPFVPPSAGNR